MKLEFIEDGPLGSWIIQSDNLPKFGDKGKSQPASEVGERSIRTHSLRLPVAAPDSICKFPCWLIEHSCLLAFIVLQKSDYI